MLVVALAVATLIRVVDLIVFPVALVTGQVNGLEGFLAGLLAIFFLAACVLAFSIALRANKLYKNPSSEDLRRQPEELHWTWAWFLPLWSWLDELCEYLTSHCS